MTALCVELIGKSVNIREVLRRYKIASGQSINFQKSSVTFGRNVSEDTRRAVQEVLELSSARAHDRYLGLPTLIGRNKKETFRMIKEQVGKKLQQWKGK